MSGIDFNHPEQYTLSIRLGTDGFSFSIYDPSGNSLLLTQRREVEAGLSITANMRKAINESDILDHAYRQTDVLPVSKRFTLIPAELFAEDRTEECFHYNFFPQENETVLYDVLPKNGAVLLYALDKSLHDLLKEQYPQVRFQSPISSRAERFAAEGRAGAGRKMYVYVHREFIEVYAYAGGRLALLNAYDCLNNADRAYYLLYAWKQLAMDQQADGLGIMGGGEDRDGLVREMRRFIRNVTLPDPDTKPLYL
jgi:hypothetical protein